MIEISPEREALLRSYAAGVTPWRELQLRGFNDYVEVLAGLAELKLRLPVASFSGPSGEARRRAVDWLESRLAAVAHG